MKSSSMVKHWLAGMLLVILGACDAPVREPAQEPVGPACSQSVEVVSISCGSGVWGSRWLMRPDSTLLCPMAFGPGVDTAYRPEVGDRLRIDYSVYNPETDTLGMIVPELVCMGLTPPAEAVTLRCIDPMSEQAPAARCTATAVVETPGVEGCRPHFRLPDGRLLEPVWQASDSLAVARPDSLPEGMSVRIAYSRPQGLGSYCMVGTPARITCFSPADSRLDTACGTSGVWRDFSGLDGCQWMIVLDDGRRLIPHFPSHMLVPRIEPGQRVSIGFTPIDSIADVCMAGQHVAVDCYAVLPPGESPAGCPPVTAKPDTVPYPDFPPQEPYARFRIADYQWRGDRLQVVVNYSGCGRVPLALHYSDAPTGALRYVLQVHGRDPGVCNMAITDTACFDMRPMADKLRRSAGLYLEGHSEPIRHPF